jgi:predicted dinucleotide-utilizing enzyme
MDSKNKFKLALGAFLFCSIALLLAGCGKVNKEAMGFISHGASLSKDVAIKFSAVKDFLHSKTTHEEAVNKWKQATQINLDGTAKGFNDVYVAAQKGSLKDITIDSLKEQGQVIKILTHAKLIQKQKDGKKVFPKLENNNPFVQAIVNTIAQAKLSGTK